MRLSGRIEMSDSNAEVLDFLREDKTLQFSRTLMLTIRQAEDTLKLVGNYDGRGDLMSAGDNLRRTVLSLHGAMKAARDRAQEGDAGDSRFDSIERRLDELVV